MVRPPGRGHPGARLLRPLREFLATEAAGGAVLVAAALVALAWANSPWKSFYEDLWTTHLFGSTDLRGLVNDGLMVVFFFVVGLEIKRELVVGELRQPRQAALPVIAAVAGMAVPAVLYLAVTAGGTGGHGWAIPMSTDIAIAVGVLALLGPRVPPGLKLFVLAVAIVDDIGAVVVIAVFYGGGVKIAIVGAFIALLVPARPRGRPASATSRSPVERLEHVFHPWSSFLVMPLFGLANAGIVLSGSALGDAASSSVTLGVVIGLVVGKSVGIGGASWLAMRFDVGRPPAGVRVRELLTAGVVCGIGFTVSIFVANLAFADDALLQQAKVGILVASVASAMISAGILWRRLDVSRNGA